MRLLDYGDDNAGVAVDDTVAPLGFRPFFDPRYLTQQDVTVGMCLHRQLLQIVENPPPTPPPPAGGGQRKGTEPADHANGPLLLAFDGESAPGLEVVFLDGLLDLWQGHVVFQQGIRID